MKRKEKILNRISSLKYDLIKLARHHTFDFFKEVELETITTCNRRCQNCPVNTHPKKPMIMDERLYTKIIDELSDIGFKGSVSPHNYGEPLLDKRLPRFMEYTRKKLPDSYIIIYSNGDFLTKELFDKLIKAGVNRFKITQYDENMSKTMKKLFSSLTKKEKKKIYYRTLKELPLWNKGGVLDIKGKKVNKCNRPLTTVVIDCKGQIVLCCNDYFSSVAFGNLNKEKLIDIWNKPAYRKARKDIKRGVYNYDICKKCVLLEV